MLTGSNSNAAAIRPALAERKKAMKSLMLTLLMVLSTLASIQYTAVDVQAASDQDGDGLPDAWEQQIIDADPGDGIETIADVLPGDDFDNDGFVDCTDAGCDETTRLVVSFPL